MQIKPDLVAACFVYLVTSISVQGRVLRRVLRRVVYNRLVYRLVYRYS